MTGIVVSIHAKGFGFIRAQRVDYFFSGTDLIDMPFDNRLRERHVQFDAVPDHPRGSRAERVRPLEAP